MSVQVISHQHYLLRLWVGFVHQVLQKVGKVLSCTLTAHPYPPPSPKRLTRHEQIDHPSPSVLVILSLVCSLLFGGTRSWWERLSTWGVASQFLALLVYAHHRIISRVGTLVHTKHIFHLGYELGSRYRFGVVADRQAPTLHFPGSKPIFFRRFITPTSEMVSMYPSSTIVSASSCNVHLALPSGGWEQASVTSLASMSPVIRGGRPGRECSRMAARPSSLNRDLMRITVRQSHSQSICNNLVTLTLCSQKDYSSSCEYSCRACACTYQLLQLFALVITQLDLLCFSHTSYLIIPVIPLLAVY